MLKKSFNDAGQETEDLSSAIHDHGQGLPAIGRQLRSEIGGGTCDSQCSSNPIISLP